GLTACEDRLAAGEDPDAASRLVVKLFRLLNGTAAGDGSRDDRLAERMLRAQLCRCCRCKELSLRDPINWSDLLRFGSAKSEGPGLVENHNAHPAERLEV